MHERLTDLRTWTVPVVATGVAVVLSVLCHAYLRPYPFVFFIGAVLVSGWYGRLVGSLIATGLGAVLLFVMHSKQLDGMATEEVQDFALRLGMFLFVGLIAGYLSRRCYHAIAAFDGLHQTLACLGQGVILTDPHGEVIYCNPEAEQLTGLEGKEVREHHLVDVVQVVRQTDSTPMALDLPKLLQDRDIVRFPDDAMLKTRRGVDLAVLGACSPIVDGDGHPVGGIVTLQDDTRRRALFADLQRRDRWAQSILQDSPMPYLLLDEQGHCQQVGRQAVALVNVSADHWMQEGWHGLMHAEDRERVLQGYRAAVAQKQPFRSDLRLENDQGDFVWVRLQAQRMNVDAGAANFIATLSVLTEEKRLEQQLDETRSLLHAVAQASPDAVFLKDAEGRCVLTNAAGANWQLSAIGDELAQAEREARSTGQPKDVAFAAQSSRARIVPYQDADNQAAGIVTFLRDTSAEHAIHTERQSWQVQAQQTSQDLDALKSRHAAEKQQLEADWQRKLQEAMAWKGENDTLRKNLANAERQSKGVQEANAQLNRQLEELQKQLRAREQACTQLEATVREARDEVALLEEELTRLQSETQDKEDHSQTIQAMRSELSALEQRLRDQSTDHEETLAQHRRGADERERLNQEEMQRWWAEEERKHHATVAALEANVQKSQEQLQAAERRGNLLHAIIRCVPDGMLALDVGDRYLAWNEQLARWTGKRAEEVVGRPAGELFEELGDLGEDRPVRQLFQGAQVVRKKGRMVLGEDGQSYRLDVTYVPIRDDKGVLLGAVATVHETATAEDSIIEATPLPEDFGEHLVEPPSVLQREEEPHPQQPPHHSQKNDPVVKHAGDWLDFN